ncbi:unnamed protein product [Cercopithifilaria johnstoni]|uniref:ANK_REP_REGION domain-containing protein n=1 Tax=Cercopithifilaria johnstoni TaxID=2874296 RepID=A0A8J2M5C4_9BILA|nr:unnamed protein product [Cercopithifilaria johnstoni]
MDEDENIRIQMDFLEVCSFGDLEQAKAMLKNGKIDRSFQHYGNGWTALHWATRRNHQEIIELLLQTGFDPKSRAKDGKTPLDLVTSKAAKEILMQFVNVEANQENAPVNYEVCCYEKLDSLHHTRFLLVRTSNANGKECFKRIAFPECGSIDVLKLTIERAMKKGKVLEVITLPDKVKIKTEEQIKDLADHQKVEIIFNSVVMNKETNCAQKLLPDEVKITSSKCDSTFEEKFANMINEHSNELTSYDRSTDNIISLNDTVNCSNVDDSFSIMKSSDSISKEQPKLSEVAVTSEYSLTAQSSSSITDIVIPCKILTKEMIKLEVVVSSQQNNDEIDSGKSVQMLKSETKENYKSAESDSEIGTEPIILPLLPQIDVNDRIFCCITESNYFAAIREEWDGVKSKDVPHKRKLQIALLIGCVVGFGGLTYMICKK